MAGQSGDAQSGHVPGPTPDPPVGPVAPWDVPAQFASVPHPPPHSMATPSRRRWLLPGVVILALALLTAAFLLLRPGVPDPDGDDSGQGAIGVAPTVPGGTGTTGSAPGAGSTPGAGQGTAEPVQNQASPAPTGSPALSAPPEVRRGSLVVTSRIVGVISYSVQITIRNDGDVAATWHSIALRLEPVTLDVTVSANVSDVPVGTVHCLVPAGGSFALTPGQSVNISASVVGVLTKATVGLDEAPCPI